MEFLLESINNVIQILCDDKDVEFWKSERVQNILRLNINICIHKHNLFYTPNYKSIDKKKLYKNFSNKIRLSVLDELKKELPNGTKIRSCIINKRIGEKWRYLTAQEKNKYDELSDNV